MSELNILFVDDEMPILRSIQRLFRNADYRVSIANSAEDALALMEDNVFHLIVSDQRMPGMDGAEFLAHVRKSHPSTIRIIMSGYADLGAVIDAVNKAHIHHFLCKPWKNDELKSVINHYLKKACFLHAASSENNCTPEELNAIIMEQQQYIYALNEQLDKLRGDQ